MLVNRDHDEAMVVVENHRHVVDVYTDRSSSFLLDEPKRAWRPKGRVHLYARDPRDALNALHAHGFVLTGEENLSSVPNLLMWAA